jgi:hypothetical protein
LPDTHDGGAALVRARGVLGPECMAKLETADELVHFVCRQLYEFTDGRPKEWRKAVGGASVHNALEQAVENGWLIVDDQDSSIYCLTDEGRRLARKTLS